MYWLNSGHLLGLLGGLLGLALHPPNYPTVAFFSVAVMVLTYHIFPSGYVVNCENPQLAGGQEASGP